MLRRVGIGSPNKVSEIYVREVQIGVGRCEQCKMMGGLGGNPNKDSEICRTVFSTCMLVTPFKPFYSDLRDCFICYSTSSPPRAC